MDMRGGVPTTSAQGRRAQYLAAYDKVTAPLSGGAAPAPILSPMALGNRSPAVAGLGPSSSSALVSPSADGVRVPTAGRYGLAAGPVPGAVSRASTRAGFPVRGGGVEGGPLGSPSSGLAPTLKSSGVMLDSASTSELVGPDSPDKQM
jgi:hypothetical protein